MTNCYFAFGSNMDKERMKKRKANFTEMQKGIRDSRVIKRYYECLLTYSIRKNQANIKYDEYNVSGFRSDILYLIKNREGKDV